MELDLNTIREEIDTINKEMLSLFERRMELSALVAAYKLEHGMEVFVPAREVQIMENVRQSSRPEFAAHNLALFNAILRESRAFQQKLINENK